MTKAGLVLPQTGLEGRLPLPRWGQVRAAAPKAMSSRETLPFDSAHDTNPMVPALPPPEGEWSKIYHPAPTENKKKCSVMSWRYELPGGHCPYRAGLGSPHGWAGISEPVAHEPLAVGPSRRMVSFCRDQATLRATATSLRPGPKTASSRPGAQGSMTETSTDIKGRTKMARLKSQPC